MTGSRTPGPRRDAGGDDDRPPLGSWAGLYAAVILSLALLILVFIFVQRSFR